MNFEPKKTETNVSVLSGEKERILCVDDEEEIVRMEQQMLEHLGYSVISRSNGVEALEAFQVAPNDYNLVITDMSMPDITGIKLAEQLIIIRKDIPIILCTGLSKHMYDEEAKSIGIRAFLTKPFKIKKLSEIIRNGLDSPWGNS